MSYIYLLKEKFNKLGIAILQTILLSLPLYLIPYVSTFVVWLIFVVDAILFIFLIFKYPKQNFERSHLRLLFQGNESLKIFVMSVILIIPCFAGFYLLVRPTIAWLIWSIAWIFMMESIIFWNGMIRIYMSSVQLGIKTRIIALVCGWIPIVNVIYLFKIIHIVDDELQFESKKDDLGDLEELSKECKTKYPIVFVHGIFFRDVKYVNYWGRIPRFLQQRGAQVYYGEQESSQSVIMCAQQLATRIHEIIDETGCKKVNVIAHSKGGLDARYAISNFGLDEYVASFSTINTPHQGCIFANYLLDKAPKRFVTRLSKMYNKAFTLLGDSEPDFLAGVSELGDQACRELNIEMPNSSLVYYQSFASYVKKARSGKFPLNVSYPIVKHFDGKNDGLVSVESASFFENNTVVHPKSDRGISHADIIDLNKENIEGFDVREFYGDILRDLKKRGY